jgi:hypothetical protein
MKFALLIDGDNISPRYVDSILAEIQKRGSCSIKRIYGDWSSPQLNGWRDSLERHCIRPIQQFRNGENATDNAIIMDTMEILLTNDRIDCFAIVSSDSDFYSLCIRIREHGRSVLGIGENKAKDILIQSCDEFVFLENLKTLESDIEIDLGKDLSNPELLLTKAYQECSQENDWVPFSKIGSVAKSIKPSFDSRTYNHQNLRSLIESLNIFEIDKDKCMPPNFFCRLKISDDIIQQKSGEIINFGAWYGFIKASDGEYYFTKSNVIKDQQNLHFTKGMKVSFDVLKKPDKAGQNNHEKNGKAGNIKIIN